MGCWDSTKYNIDRFLVWSNREPVLSIRRVLWFLTTGWALFVAYIMIAVGMIASILLLPFAPQVFLFACFALDPVCLEPYYEEVRFDGKHVPFYKNPGHPFCLLANVVWLVFFGWAVVVLFVLMALVQALTIINFGTALALLELAGFALWPYGRLLRRRHLPTTLEELHAMRAKQEEQRGDFARMFSTREGDKIRRSDQGEVAPTIP